jgi:formate dehydrogenase maturation protein FdhE
MADTTNTAIKRCPFCGSGAEMRQVDDEDSENFGGYFIECIVCHCSTDLRFSCGDDARPLVIEKWNRRAA